ncbi:hypothetical protein [Thalassospira lohafexi]|uniref:Uncharacterized protein n=1 Tax=Thalassospira lohafexi TaxID=744227 RepID=A0A2N3L5E7_9PROT|nr:hypothetical protein [Thalassospira lohafexi]PKR57917.1 hypothetical protein COO92_14240 [Thalassospira lohafexi]
MGETANQEKCCEIVVRILEKITHSKRTNESSPDKEDRNNKATELHVELNKNSYWIEHTQIEPYENALRSNSKFSKIHDELEKQKFANVPSHASVQISFSHKLYEVSDREVGQFARKSALWINSILPRSEDLGDHKFFEDSTIIDEIELKVLITTKGLGGSMLFSRFPPMNLEISRLTRTKRAFTEKSKKFSAFTASKDKSVLVLEFNDIALSEPNLIINKIEQVYQAKNINRNEAPILDEVFLIDSDEDRWMVWHVIHDQKLCSKRREPIPKTWYQ